MVLEEATAVKNTLTVARDGEEVGIISKCLRRQEHLDLVLACLRRHQHMEEYGVGQDRRGLGTIEMDDTRWCKKNNLVPSAFCGFSNFSFIRKL